MSMFHRAICTARAIPGCDLYQIDAFGNVFSLRRPSVRRLRPGLAGNGYLTVALYRKSYTIHQLMQLAFFPGTREQRLVLNHKDGNKLNNRLENLEVVTWSENNAHALRMGLRGTTRLNGEGVRSSLLRTDQVAEIKARIRAGEKDTAIATSFSVHRSTIQHIRINKSWKHIQ